MDTSQIRHPYEFELDIDPDTLGTAQQRRVGINKYTGRICVRKNERVAASMKAVKLLSIPHRRAVLRACPAGCPVKLDIVYWFAYPKRTPKMRMLEGAPMIASPDCDNIHKAVQDAFTLAGLWPDDKLVTDLRVRKVRTMGRPRVSVRVCVDPMGVACRMCGEVGNGS